MKTYLKRTEFAELENLDVGVPCCDKAIIDQFHYH